VQTKFGTSDAESLTLSFWIKANRSQTLGVNFENELPVGGGADQGYQTSQTYTTANTWQKMVITIPGDTRTGKGFTWNSLKALTFDISLSEAGSDSGGGTASATWSDLTQNQKCTHNTEHFADSTANYFNITGVKLELGSEATDFQHTEYGEELAKCKRYFEKQTGSASCEQGIVARTTSTREHVQKWGVTKRATPSITFSTNGYYIYANHAIDTGTSTGVQFATVHSALFSTLGCPARTAGETVAVEHCTFEADAEL